MTTVDDYATTRVEYAGAKLVETINVDGVAVDVLRHCMAERADLGETAVIRDVAYLEAAVAGSYTVLPAYASYYINKGEFHEAGQRGSSAHSRLADPETSLAHSTTMGGLITAARRTLTKRAQIDTYGETARRHVRTMSKEMFQALPEDAEIKPGDLVCVHGHGAHRQAVAVKVTRTKVLALFSTPSGEGHLTFSDSKKGSEVRLVGPVNPPKATTSAAAAVEPVEAPPVEAAAAVQVDAVRWRTAVEVCQTADAEARNITHAEAALIVSLYRAGAAPAVEAFLTTGFICDPKGTRAQRIQAVTDLWRGLFWADVTQAPTAELTLVKRLLSHYLLTRVRHALTGPVEGSAAGPVGGWTDPDAVQAPAAPVADTAVWVAVARKGVDYHSMPSAEAPATRCGRSTRTGRVLLLCEAVELHHATPCKRCQTDQEETVMGEVPEESLVTCDYGAEYGEGPQIDMLWGLYVNHLPYPDEVKQQVVSALFTALVDAVAESLPDGMTWLPVPGEFAFPIGWKIPSDDVVDKVFDAAFESVGSQVKTLVVRFSD